MILGHVRAEMVARLRRAGVERPEWEARQLLRAGAGLTDRQVLLGSSLYMPDRTADRLFELCRSRAAGRPLAYLLGQWDFMDFTLRVTPDVLIPREDTIVPVRAAAAFAGSLPHPPRVLDLCCGSGCAGIALARLCPGVQLVLADISPAALELARQNARDILGREIIVPCLPEDALAGPSPRLGRFDLILCNPPYIADGEWETLDPSVRLHEPAMALRGGPDGLDFFRAVTALWRESLHPGGLLAFETGYAQSAAVRALMAASGFEDLAVHLDGGGHGRAVTGRAADFGQSIQKGDGAYGQAESAGHGHRPD